MTKTIEGTENLFKMAQRGNVEARKKIVLENLGLAYSEAAKSCYRNRGLELEDLREEAVMGLFQAISGFDTEKGLRFSTYAIPCIRHAILEALRKAEIVVVPKDFSKKRASLACALSENENVSLSVEEKIKKATRASLVPEKKATFYLSILPKGESLDAENEFDGESKTKSELPSRFKTPEEMFFQKETEVAVRTALKRLRRQNPRAFYVLSQHRGFFSCNGSGKSFLEISATLGMTRQNACAIEHHAIRLFSSYPEIKKLLG